MAVVLMLLTVFIQGVLFFLLWKSASIAKPRVKRRMEIFLYIYTLTCICLDVFLLVSKIVGVTESAIQMIDKISSVLIVISLVLIIPCVILILFLIGYHMKGSTTAVRMLLSKDWFLDISMVIPMIALINGIISMGLSIGTKIL